MKVFNFSVSSRLEEPKKYQICLNSKKYLLKKIKKQKQLKKSKKTYVEFTIIK